MDHEASLVLRIRGGPCLVSVEQLFPGRSNGRSTSGEFLCLLFPYRILALLREAPAIRLSP
jgi:hypothetical protein